MQGGSIFLFVVFMLSSINDKIQDKVNCILKSMLWNVLGMVSEKLLKLSLQISLYYTLKISEIVLLWIHLQLASYFMNLPRNVILTKDEGPTYQGNVLSVSFSFQRRQSMNATDPTAELHSLKSIIEVTVFIFSIFFGRGGRLELLQRFRSL